MNDARQIAGEEAALLPTHVTIGNRRVRAFAAGDVVLCSRLGLAITSGDPKAVAALDKGAVTYELSTIGALLCYEPEALMEQMAMGDEKSIRTKLVGPLLFSLTPTELGELIGWTTKVTGLAQLLAFEVEPKPSTGGSAEEPVGK